MKVSLKKFLNEKAALYNRPDFIAEDPISIPHRFSLKQDIEIAGFFAALFAWGNRTTIINKSNDLLKRMDNAPYDFIKNHEEQDLKTIIGFKHRTFTDTDILYFIQFLHHHYQQSNTLESAFTKWMNKRDRDTGSALNGFQQYFFSLEDAPRRTHKHIAIPNKNSSCKRLNMFLRWMVRKDKMGVDFGIWENLKPSQLICPIDLHVARVAKRFGLLDRPNADWKAAVSLTNELRKLDPEDPVKYDFALFGLGVVEKY